MATTIFTDQEQSLNAGLTNGTVWFDTRNATHLTLHVEDQAIDASTTAWNSATFDVLWSSERGGAARAFPSAIGIAQATPDEMNIDVSFVPWVAVRVATAQSNVHVRVVATATDAQS